MAKDNHNKYQDDQIADLKKAHAELCEEVKRSLDRNSSAVIRLQGEIKNQSNRISVQGRRIDILSKTILGNGDPDRSLISQVARNKTELKIYGILLLAVISGMIGFFINSRF